MRERGFTLVEMLITTALLVLVVSVLLGTLHRTQGEAERIETLVETRQSARAAVQLLERDVRMSGSGWGRTPVVISFNGAADTLFAITPGPGAGPNTSDSLLIMGAWSASSPLAATMPNPSSNLKVEDVTGFAAGDMVVISDGTSAHMFEVTGVNASSGHLQHNPSSPWNPPGGFSPWPNGGYGAGAQVFKVNILSYQVDSTSYRRPALVRREFRGSPEIVAYDVDRFQVWYRMQDGSNTRSPGLGAAAVVSIDKVRPIIYTRLTDRWRPVFVDSVWAEVRPRTF
ncbi:MAG: prepilin-type N-terminal cleavage/methylation domain-containing protein [Candidatus Eisenbacteria bacterium]